MDYTNFALEKLKEAGLKITNPRKMLVSFLAKSDKVLSPYEMKALLKREKINADVVTIYRVLEVLESMSLVHKVQAFNGYVRCHTKKMERGACHHYLLCRSCRKVEEVEGENLSQLEKKIAQNCHFTIESHYLEFMGLCAACKKKQQK